ncbi:MAG: single-stranded-DNA-specific exonuclease RecJ [Deltaproteobacteria bacterium]|nr:single-stranded-DNA-specific exonuclease RecJ [Deltaproteobacteria bacterium]
MAAPPTKWEWKVKPATPREAFRLASQLNIPPVMAQVLWHRGFKDPRETRDFLSPRLADLPGPQGFCDLEKAAGILAQAVQAGQVLGVAGDYDADGVTATALLLDFFRQVGAATVWDLPHRLADGYGFSPERAERLAADGAQVVVTVDCGISDHAGVSRAKELGLTVVVTDHHQVPPGPLVPAHAVVNPQRQDCGYAPHLAGVGVAFYLAAAVRSHLRDMGAFAGGYAPNLRRSLDLVAVGTCADVVPLVGHNRILVNEGLRVLNEAGRTGLNALKAAAGLAGALDVRDVAFGLAPRLNAAGRLDHPARALEVLLSESPAEATELAGQLDRLNQRRRSLELKVFEEVKERVAADSRFTDAPCLVLGDPGWHRGVLGIVASRLVEALGRPAILFAVENGKAVGSGRSVPGFHMQKALSQLEDLLLGYGGHAMAAGVTVASQDLERLGEALSELAQDQLPPPGGPRLLELEAEAELDQLGPACLEPLERMAPFGEGNPEPRLAVRRARVVAQRVVGQGHLKLTLAPAEAGPGWGFRLPAFGFGLAGQSPGTGQLVDLAAAPRISSYGGRHLELNLLDVRTVD